MNTKYKTVRDFARFVSDVRQFFLNQGFDEIFTPTLVRCPGLEPSLEPFSTEVNQGRQSTTAYLPTSPEIHLKKALCQGWKKIFEIKNCFRKGEFSPHHENEFLMLEWYRSEANLDQIAQDIAALFDWLHTRGWGQPESIQTTTWAELFQANFGFNLHPQSTLAELESLCRRLDLHFTADDTFDDLFHRLVIDRLEPKFSALGPLLVRRFPPSQAALAKLDSEGWADRLELYWNGLEIANGFNEVTDADEMRARWDGERLERRRLKTSPVPFDQELLDLLSAEQMPQTGGIALGVERLFMAAQKISDIRQLRMFSSSSLFVAD